MKYIKLFEEQNSQSTSLYDFITMTPFVAFTNIVKEIYKDEPDIEYIKNIFEYAVVDINIADRIGTLLIYACSKNQEEIVKLLLNHSEIDPNIKGDFGSTALHHAVKTEKSNIVKLLLELPNIDLNVQEEYGRTALIHASDYNRTINNVELLLNHPDINPNLQDKRGWTALMWVVRERKYDFADLFIWHPKTDLNIQNELGDTALMLAVVEEDTDMIRYLLENKGIDKSIESNYNLTAWDKATDFIRDEFPELNPNY
jgi:ankyrin repeat protein